jgi:hypothetical protein
MKKRNAAGKILVVVLLLSLSYSAFSQAQNCYPDAPNILVCNADLTARQIVTGINDNGPNAVAIKMQDLMFYTVADATIGIRNLGPICESEEYQYLGETARTDKQIGAGAGSQGTTTLVEKAGFAQILGLAIERGAILQSVNGSSLTLSTSPYLVIAAAEGDTAATYQNYSLFNRIGVSGTFAISDQSNVLASVRSMDLSEWSARFRLSGDRSTRSKEFQKFWEENIKGVVQARANIITDAQTIILNDPALSRLLDRFTLPATHSRNAADPLAAELSLRDKIASYLANHQTATPDVKINDIKAMILCHLRTFLYAPVKAGTLTISDATRTKIRDQLLPALAASQLAVLEAKKLLEEHLKNFERKALVTFAYTNSRPVMLSQYSALKVLFERGFANAKVVGNFSITLYHDPDSLKNQDKVRDFGGAVSLEGKLKNPFSRALGSDSADLSKMTFSFSGRFQRMKENEGMPGKRADIAVGQLKLEIPISAGVSVPVSLTFANATELIDEKVVRGNFGITFDADKLFALTRALAKR